MATMKKRLKKYGIYLIFAGIGAAAGFAYWYFIGCKSGTCPITSKWMNTTLYGALLGYLAGDLILGMFKKKTKQQPGSGETTNQP